MHEGAREMAQWAKHILCECEELGWDVKTPYESPVLYDGGREGESPEA